MFPIDTVHVDEGLAFVGADANFIVEGDVRSNNLDCFTLILTDGTWKFVNASCVSRATKQNQPPHSNMMTSRSAGRIALAGFGLHVLSLIALHALRTDYDPTVHFVSGYANGPYAWLLHAGQVGSFLGTLALLSGLRSAHLAAGCSAVFIGLCINVAMKPLGFLFPMDAAETAFDAAGSLRFSTAGWIHAISGMIGAITMMAVMLVLTLQLQRLKRIRGGFHALWFGCILGPVCYGATIATPPATFPSGLYQRAFIAFTLLWLVVVSGGLASTALTGLPGTRDGVDSTLD